MGTKLTSLINRYLKADKKTIEGDSYRIENPLVLFKKGGVIRLSDNYEIPFNSENKDSIIQMVSFILSAGIHFGEKKYQWKFDKKSDIIETHQGIKFKINNIALLDETFLFESHFSGFDVRDKVVVTGGAYIGDTPLYYSYYGAKVYAFEPSPASFKLATENILLNEKLNGNIALINFAIGRDEQVQFPNDTDSSASSLYDLSGKNTVVVRSVSISTILREFELTEPYLLDLDIKGSEFTLIEDTSISNFKKVRIEYSPFLLGKQNYNLDYLIEKLKSYGFSKFRIYKHYPLRFDLINHGTIYCEK